MIPIRNDLVSQFATEHFEAIYAHLENTRTGYNYNDIDDWCRNNGLHMSFRDIIIASPGKLPTIKNAYKNLDYPKCIKYISNTLYTRYFANSSKTLIDTYYNAGKLVNKLGINVCPYCNRNYINNVSYADQNIKRTGQMDHFYPKNKYPFLAMSFFNLIPSCSSCNHIKSNKTIYYSPYNDKPYSDKLFNFGIDIDSWLNAYDKNRIKITLKNPHKRMRSNIDIFRLESQYKIHHDIVQELIMKKYIYTEAKLNELKNDFNELFEKEEDLTRTLFGNYLNKNEWYKRPLSKLISDIYHEISND